MKTILFNGKQCNVVINRPEHEPAIASLLEHACERFSSSPDLSHYQKLGYGDGEVRYEFRDMSWLDRSTFGVSLFAVTAHSEHQCSTTDQYQQWVYWSTPTAKSTKRWWDGWTQTMSLLAESDKLARSKKEQTDRENLWKMFTAGKLFVNEAGIKPLSL